MISRLYPFRGGIQLRQHKKQSTTRHVQQASIPKKLILPLKQHIGNPTEPVVNIGDKVFYGQVIAKANNDVSVPIHAPTSGTVVEIAPHPIPHASGLSTDCIVIETDGQHRSRRKETRHRNYLDYSAEELREQIRLAGIVGLGGAGFPSYIKLDNGEKVVDTLILNGAECEPYITCDDMLMREQATEIVEGLAIMHYALQAKQCIIAIENNKSVALQNISQAVKNSGHDFIDIVQLPTVYPTGGEKQLIQILTGKEVTQHNIPLDIGIVCHNVATAYAVSRAVEHGQPLTSRYVTITGSVAKSQVLDVMLGTPVCDLIEECGGNRQTLAKLIMGGPMMGFALKSDEVPVIKTTNCLLVNSVISDVPLPSRAEHSLPCIRCGACAEACPVNLLPQQMYWFAKAKDLDKVQDYNLFDCIECGCCDYVCPSHIPLVQYYRYAKSEIWNLEHEREKADISRRRHEFNQFRIEREKQERAERHRQKRIAINGESENDKKQAAIQAALNRVKNKQNKQHVKPKNTDNLNEHQRKLIEEVDARRRKINQNGNDAPANDENKTQSIAKN